MSLSFYNFGMELGLLTNIILVSSGSPLKLVNLVCISQNFKFGGHSSLLWSGSHMPSKGGIPEVPYGRTEVKPSKCFLFRETVKYLGHVVFKEGVSTDSDKIEAVKSWPTPVDVQGVQSFLGLASYYKRFIRGFADVARPLHRLTEKAYKKGGFSPRAERPPTGGTHPCLPRPWEEFCARRGRKRGRNRGSVVPSQNAITA